MGYKIKQMYNLITGILGSSESLVVVKKNYMYICNISILLMMIPKFST